MVCCRHWSRRPWRGAWPLGLSEHLGYDRGEPTSQARGNARNGTTSKTVDSEVGPFEIEVPRDRAGTFTPRLVRKGQRRLDGLDACESPGLTRRWNDGAGYPAPPGLHAQRGAQRGDHFEDHRRGHRSCPGVAAPPTGGVLPGGLPRARFGSRSASITGSPPARPTSRSEWTWTVSSTWLKYLGPGPGEGASLKGGSCALSWPTGASRTS